MPWYIYIYIYIYIVIHRQTVSFYQNSSVWLDTQDARSRDRNPSHFTLDCISDHLGTKQTTLAKEILRYFLFLETAAAAFVYIFFNTLSATRVLNSFEELCITRAAADNSFARELNPHGGAYIYIYIYQGGKNGYHSNKQTLCKRTYGESTWHLGWCA